MFRKIGTFVVFILILAASACQKNSAETDNQNVKPSQTASTTPKLAPSPPKNGNYSGKGVVTKINLELVSVELKHEKIEGFMEAMTMEFYVTKKTELERLKVGDKVEFVIELKDGQEKIVSIKKAE
jgi:Cu/Ag efflux protein CusF